MTDPIQSIKSRQISSVIRNYVKLTNVSKNQFRGLCPFHKEKTPSFIVDDLKNFYKCFGCGEGGDSISFIKKLFNLNFQDALERVCNILGIEFERKTIKNYNKEINEKYYLINRQITNFYQNSLKKNKEAISYLEKRGLSDQIIKSFQIGFAPNRFEFMEFVRNSKIEINLLKNLNLIKEYNNKLIPFFENRIIIPILDRYEKIIGFGGRIISQDKNIPKYINSSNSEIFKKNENLYNINNIIAKKIETLFILEGYMDVITMNSYGFDAIASLGTAINENQLKDILKLNSCPIFCFDNDEAGLKATMNLLEKCLEIIEPGDKIKILKINNSKDVDEYLRKYGKENFLRMLDSDTKEIQDFIFNFYINKYDYSNPNDLSLLEDILINRTCKLIKNEIVRENYKKFFKEKLFLMKYKKKTNPTLKKITKELLLDNYIKKLITVCKKINISKYEEKLTDLSQRLKDKTPNNLFSKFIETRINSIEENETSNEDEEQLKKSLDILCESIKFQLDSKKEMRISRIERKNILDKKKTDYGS